MIFFAERMVTLTNRHTVVHEVLGLLWRQEQGDCVAVAVVDAADDAGGHDLLVWDELLTDQDVLVEVLVEPELEL